MNITRVTPVLLAATVLGLAGCSDQGADTAASTTTTTTTTVATTTAEPTATETTTEPTATETTTETATAGDTATGSATEAPAGAFDVNAASQEEIESRLQQAGVPDAGTWAERIKQNGPYTAENAATKVQDLARQFPMDMATMNEIRKALGF